MLSNLKTKAKPTNLDEFPMQHTDVVAADPGAGYTTEYACFVGMRLPSDKKCIIVATVTEDATGEITNTLYMQGSTGSQFDFSCDWADRLTGTFLNPNTQV